MPPRAMWTGTISFGLVSVPVRMYGAVAEHKLHFHYVHAPDGSRIGYQKVCKSEDRPVPDSEIVKAFEIEKGEWVYMSDEDFEAAEAEDTGQRTIEIRAFVPYEEIDPIYFERTYYLGPEKGGDKVYALLARAMEASGLAGVVKFVMRDRQNLGCLRVRDGVMTLERMHFADEIRDPEGIAPEQAKLEKAELEMAAQLIEQYRGDFEPERYRDTYRDALCEIIRAKQRGETVRAPAEEEAEAPTDLMAALRASVEAARKRRPEGFAGDGELESLSRDELYRLAKGSRHPWSLRDVKGRTRRGAEGGGLVMRTMFTAYLLFTFAGLVFYVVVGLTHN